MFHLTIRQVHVWGPPSEEAADKPQKTAWHLKPVARGGIGRLRTHWSVAIRGLKGHFLEFRLQQSHVEPVECCAGVLRLGNQGLKHMGFLPGLVCEDIYLLAFIQNQMLSYVVHDQLSCCCV